MGTDCGRVIVADGDGRLRSLVSTLFQRTGYRTTEARSGHEVLAAVRRRRPALVLLEVQLAGVSGYEVCHELRERYGDDFPIVFMSGTRTEASDRVAGLLLGADDYIVKPFDPDELLARARRLISSGNGEAPLSSEDRSAPHAGLTRREREVLELLSAGLQQRDIAKRLFISPKTVATHIQRILSKLDVHSRAEAVARAHRDGLVGDFAAHSRVVDGPAATTT
jgi:DNA-binding NarL/FixJ family response regulator